MSFPVYHRDWLPVMESSTQASRPRPRLRTQPSRPRPRPRTPLTRQRGTRLKSNSRAFTCN